MDLRGFFLDNLGIKAVSLAVAVALAIFVRGEKTAIGNFRVKVNYLVDEARILTSTPQGEITLRLKGPETMISQLRESDLSPVVIDLPKQQSGQYCPEYRPADLPPRFQSMQVEEILPRCISLKLERRIEKEVLVVPDIVGTPEAGYSLGNISSDPPKVTLYGAESAVREVHQVRTEPLSIALAKETKEEEVPLFPLSEGAFIGYKGGTPPRVKVKVEVLPQKVEKTLRGVRIVPVPALVDEESLGILPERLDLVVYGPKPALDAIDPNDLAIVVDISAALPAVTSKTPVTLTADPSRVQGLPQDVFAVSFRPGPEVKLYSRK